MTKNYYDFNYVYFAIHKTRQEKGEGERRKVEIWKRVGKGRTGEGEKREEMEREVRVKREGQWKGTEMEGNGRKEKIKGKKGKGKGREVKQYHNAELAHNNTLQLHCEYKIQTSINKDSYYSSATPTTRKLLILPLSLHQLTALEVFCTQHQKGKTNHTHKPTFLRTTNPQVDIESVMHGQCDIRPMVPFRPQSTTPYLVLNSHHPDENRRLSFLLPE